jgi:hypothetical protein
MCYFFSIHVISSQKYYFLKFSPNLQNIIIFYKLGIQQRSVKYLLF